MTRLPWILIACCFASGARAIDDSQRFAKPLTLPDFENEELVAVPLDTDIFARSEHNYPDLRIIDSQDKEIAFIIRRAQAKRSERVWDIWHAENIALKPLDDGGLEITFRSDLKQHPRAPRMIRFLSSNKNFEHRVKVESSTHGHNWSTLVEDGLIFDYSQFMDVRSLAIELPEIPTDEAAGGPPSFYRLTIADVTQEQESQLMQLSRNLKGDEETERTERTVINRQPFRIDRIELRIDEIREDVSGDRRQAYPISIERVEQDLEHDETHLYLKSHREPLTEISIVTPARNFAREARLSVPVEGSQVGQWRLLGTSNLSRIDFRTLKQEFLKLDFPETRASQYRLVIKNGDSPPLEVTEVNANGHVYEAIFFADQGVNYQMAYGGESLSPPDYDTAAIAASLREGFTPLTATLGDEATSEVLPVPTGVLITRLLNNTWFMTAVIGVLVLVLAAGLYRATRHLDDLGEPPA